MRVQVSHPPPPWRCQYDNNLHPAGSCNMTSAWMAIEYYHPGRVKNPDVLLAECDRRGLDRHALEVIDLMLEEHGVADRSGYTFTMEDIKKHLDTGNLVIVQGVFTPSGHIVLVYGYDTDKGVWLVNDPAGRFENGKYNGWKSGCGIEYPSDWFRAKAAPDGHAWAHLLKAAK